MPEIDDTLDEISDKMSEHILAVKGTLELVDASVSEDDLHNLLLKALERMESMERLSQELFGALKQVFSKMSQTRGNAQGE